MAAPMAIRPIRLGSGITEAENWISSMIQLAKGSVSQHCFHILHKHQGRLDSLLVFAGPSPRDEQMV